MSGKSRSSGKDISYILISALVVGMGLVFGILTTGFSPATLLGRVHAFFAHPITIIVLSILFLAIVVAATSEVIRASRTKQESLDRLRRRQEDLVKPIRIYDLGEDLQGISRVRLNEIPGMIAQLCRRDDMGVPDLVDSVLCHAILMSSSDIHIEPSSQFATVKYRIDGALNDVGQIPKDLMARVSSRLRVLANLTIYEKGKPQDGRIELAWKKEHFDIRISFLPTLHGDKVVIRLFESGAHDFNLVNLGMSAPQLELVTGILLRPQGTLLLTGPTGSGKTTTIYSSVRYILQNRGETTNIVTIEDPIEREIIGINQTQVNPKRDLTFSTGLRSILRQDPDVIVVGEVRDRETAEICTQASLTGHLVISTIHADSAVGVFNRLIEMGIEPFLVASSVSGIVSQRLVRRNCPHCIAPVVPSLKTLKLLKIRPDQSIEFVHGKGCEKCEYRGYKGRIGVFEMLQPSHRLRAALQEKVSTGELHRLAREDGMITLLEDGLNKVVNGLIDVEELVRVLI
ncbi:type II/IV secretion system protein [bacterium]|nr:type II/IV secretion system protein [candidate division CSSED10-310 bacterium]